MDSSRIMGGCAVAGSSFIHSSVCCFAANNQLGKTINDTSDDDSPLYLRLSYYSIGTLIETCSRKYYR